MEEMGVVKKTELIEIIGMMFKSKIKGQITIDFSGNEDNSRLKFTNIGIEDLIKFKEYYDE